MKTKLIFPWKLRIGQKIISSNILGQKHVNKIISIKKLFTIGIRASTAQLKMALRAKNRLNSVCEKFCFNRIFMDTKDPLIKKP